MPDIQYLNYGDLQQVEKLALLDRMADDVAMYVNKLPWSNKRRNKFISAYSDILAHGILGASNNLGQWVINVNGLIGLESKSKMDKLMYREAAWYIRHLMKSLAQDKLKEEESSPKTPFDFKKDFISYVSSRKFGSNSFTTSLWNEFDERDLYGIRGTLNRMKILSDLLKDYSDKFDESKFDFKDSPYENSTDLKNRINEAIVALGTPDKHDDLEKLYAIGLDPADWFNNGSGDPSGHGELTNSQYRDYIEQEKQKVRILTKLTRIKDLLEQLNKLKLIRKAADDVKAIGDRLIQENSSSSSDYNYNTTGLVADISSILGDVVSLAGGHVGVAGGLWSLGSDIVGDIAKEKGIGTIALNTLGNLFWTAAGAVPGVKSARLVKKVGRIYAAISPIIVGLDPSVLKTWKKMLGGDFNLSKEDIENIKLTMHLITGGANAIRGARADRKISAGVRNLDRKIKLTDGTIKELTELLFSELKKIGVRKGLKAALEYLSKVPGFEGKTPVEGQFTFSEKGVSRLNPTYFSEKVRNIDHEKHWWVPIRSNPYVVDLNKVSQLRTQVGSHPSWNFRSVFSGGSDNKFNNTPRLEISQSLNRYLPEDQQINIPLFGGNKFKSLFNQLSNNTTNSTSGQATTNPTTTNSTSGQATTNPRLNRAIMNRYRNVLEGNYSKIKVKEGTYKIGGLKIEIKSDGSGRFNMVINGKTNAGNSGLMKEEIAKRITTIVLQYRNSVDTSGKVTKKSISEIGKVLLELKILGWLKQGGRIDKLKIQKYKEYILK